MNVAERTVDLLSHGYQPIDEVKGLRVGDRARHVGQQFTRAYLEGSGVIVAIFERDPSAWSVEWGRRDIELIFKWDDPERGIDGVSVLADYHIDVVSRTEAAS